MFSFLAISANFLFASLWSSLEFSIILSNSALVSVPKAASSAVKIFSSAFKISTLSSFFAFLDDAMSSFKVLICSFKDSISLFTTLDVIKDFISLDNSVNNLSLIPDAPPSFKSLIKASTEASLRPFTLIVSLYDFSTNL